MSSKKIGRRNLFKKAAEMCAAGVVGQFAVETLSAAKAQTARTIGEVWQEVLEKYLGGTVDVIAWNGGQLVRIECLFTDGPNGYQIRGRRIISVIKNGERCAELGRDMIELGLLFLDQENLQIDVDLSEVRGLVK